MPNRSRRLKTIREVNEHNNYSLSNINLNNNAKVKRIRGRNNVTAKKVMPKPRSRKKLESVKLESNSRPKPKISKTFTSSLTGQKLRIPLKKQSQDIKQYESIGFKGLSRPSHFPPRPSHLPQHNYLNKNELKGIQMNSPMNNYDKWDIVKIKVKGKPIYGKIIFIQKDKMNNIIEVECSPEFSNYMLSKIGLKSIYEKTYDTTSKMKKRYVGIKEIRDNIMPSYKAAEQDRIKLLEKLLSSKMPIDPKLLPIIHNPNEFKKMYTMANLGTEF